MKQCLNCGKDGVENKFCSKKCSAIFKHNKSEAVTKVKLEELLLSKSVVEISNICKITISTVYKYIKKYKLKRPGNKKIIDYTKRQFGGGNVLSVSDPGGNGRHIKYKCICGCGKEFITYSNRLAKANTISCSVCSAKRRRTQHPIKNYLWKSLEYGARVRRNGRGIDFNLDKDAVYNLFVKQNFKCALTGVDICLPQCITEYNKGLYTASLDRIDSNLGYTIDNVQWIHKKLNWMKGALSQQEFIDWCKLVVSYKENEDILL